MTYALGNLLMVSKRNSDFTPVYLVCENANYSVIIGEEEES
jgi:hypothetical protein